MERTKIYLIENCHGDPTKVYIGKTKNSRENSHKKFFGVGLRYTYIDEVDSFSYKDWKPLECYWIEQFKQWGFNVQNRNKGGGGPEFQNEKTKKKISDKINSHPTRGGNISKSLKGKYRGFHKPDTGLKISKTKKGFIQNYEWRSNISKSTLGNTNKKGWVTPSEVKEKISKALKGKKRNPTQIKNMSKPKSHKENFGKHRIGFNVTQETRDKLKENNPRKKPVIQYNKQMEFMAEYEGVRETARQTGAYDSSITMCCKGRLKTTKGFIFKYK